MKYQYKEYLNPCKALIVKLKCAKRASEFGYPKTLPVGKTPIRFPIDDEGNFFELECVIVNALILILLGLDISLCYGMIIDFGRQILGRNDWKAPMIHKD